MNLTDCRICPRNCGINRFTARGFCLAGAEMRVNCHQLHHWEEPVISGSNGSGTIFFSGCNMKCVYCQNYEISQEFKGKNCSCDELVSMMLELQQKEAHSVNLVTPTHFTPQIREALVKARNEGLNIPIVWNSNAYEKVETLKTLEGLVDIYMPDFRYWSPESSATYSAAPDYAEFAKSAILEMFRQVGHLNVIGNVAASGLLIRILVLPGNLNGADKIIRWICDNTGADTYISLMGQYYPTYRAGEFSELNRSVTRKEYSKLENLLDELGFSNGFVQKVGSDSKYTPDFQK